MAQAPPKMIGKTSIDWLLSQIGTWHVESTETFSHTDAILYAGDQGWITIRAHFAEKYPHGIKCYELTDNGIAMVEQLGGQENAILAIEQREFYRRHTTEEAFRAVQAGKQATEKPLLH